MHNIRKSLIGNKFSYMAIFIIVALFCMFSFFSFTKTVYAAEDTAIEDAESVDIAACTNNDRRTVMIRTGFSGYDEKGNRTGWFGDRYFFVFLPTDTYTDCPYNNVALDSLTGYNVLDYIEFETWEGETKKLRDIYNSNGDIVYRKFGDVSSIAFDIGKADSSNPYDGLAFKAIRILKGCEFPDYRSTNNGSVLKKYVQVSTIQLTYELVVGVEANFNTNWFINTELGNEAEVANVSFDNEGYFNINLNNMIDYPTENAIECCGFESSYYFDKYVFLNGISLYELKKNSTENKSVSRMGYENGSAFFGIPVPSSVKSGDITEIIVSSGCRIPSYVNSEKGVAAYGENYYTVHDTVTFTKSADGVFAIKEGKTVWTLTFDNANPVKITDNTRLKASDIPDAPEKEGYLFVGWYNGIMELTPGTLINSGLNYTSKYIKAHTVTLDYGNGKVEKVVVGHNRKLTIPENGYVVEKWKTESGKIYNLEKNIRSDMTLYAVGTSKTDNRAGCGSSIGYANIWSILVIAIPCFIILTVGRRKRNI